jgi:uncharacterized membrane protein
MNSNTTHHHHALRAPALLAILIALLFAPWAAAQYYSPTDIVGAAGGFFRADAMNDLGQVCGGYTPPGGLELPAVWENGVVTQLALLAGAESGWARGLNNLGQIVGACRVRQSDGSVPSQACLWENGTVRALPGMSGTTESAAWAINDAGTIIGHIYTPLPYNGPFRQAVVWKGSTIAKLLPPAPGAQTWARAIDSLGRVAVSWNADPQMDWEWNPARWTPDVPNGSTGTMTTLGTWGAAYDINDSGVVSGNQGSYGYLWNGTNEMEMLSPYWGHVKVHGINNAGVAVGSNDDSDAYITTALVWDQGNYGRDLNLLLNSSTAFASPGTLAESLAINGSGQILVFANGSHFVLLTPSSQPPGPQLPAPPTYVSAWAGHGMVDLYWPAPYFATSYNVKRATISGGPYTTIATGVEWNAFQDSAVVNGTRYYYVVSSVADTYESADSAEASAMPLAPPVAPTNLTASIPKGGKSVKLTWIQSASSGLLANRVYRSASGGAYAHIAQITAGTSYLDQTVRRGVTYSYKVSAVNSNGQESPASNVITVRTK